MTRHLPPACAVADPWLVDLAYDTGEAPEAARRHVSDCPRCSGELRSLNAVRAAAASLPLLEPSDDLDRKLLVAVDDELARAAPAREDAPAPPANVVPLFRRKWMAPLSIAAAMAILVGLQLLEGPGFARFHGDSEPVAAVEASTPLAAQQGEPEKAAEARGVDDVERERSLPVPAADAAADATVELAPEARPAASGSQDPDPEPKPGIPSRTRQRDRAKKQAFEQAPIPPPAAARPAPARALPSAGTAPEQEAVEPVVSSVTVSPSGRADLPDLREEPLAAAAAAPPSAAAMPPSPGITAGAALGFAAGVAAPEAERSERRVQFQRKYQRAEVEPVESAGTLVEQARRARTDGDLSHALVLYQRAAGADGATEAELKEALLGEVEIFAELNLFSRAARRAGQVADRFPELSDTLDALLAEATPDPPPDAREGAMPASTSER